MTNTDAVSVQPQIQWVTDHADLLGDADRIAMDGYDITIHGDPGALRPLVDALGLELDELMNTGNKYGQTWWSGDVDGVSIRVVES